MKIINGCEFSFSKENKAIESANSGELLLFKTKDCFNEQISSEKQLITQINFDVANPTAGPVYINDAKAGDILVVDILDINVCSRGFACSIPNMGPLSDLAVTRTKVFNVEDGFVKFNDISWPINPMVGVIGSAPLKEPVPCGFAHNHGGNMDSKVITKGSKVYLPVRIDGALLQMGDLHATMGDGEVCGTGIEISGEVLVNTRVIKNIDLNWPVTETNDFWYVNTTGRNYDEALAEGCKELARLMEPVYNWDVTDIFIYLSVQGNVEINQGARPAPGDMLTLRVGIPKICGKNLL